MQTPLSTSLNAAPTLYAFTARALNASDAAAFRTVRLKYLQTTPGLIGLYEIEAKHTPQQWVERCIETSEHCFFGTFEGQTLIGIVSADSWDEDTSGRTVLWKSAYLEPEYRGRRIAAPMYQAREEWTRRRFDRAVFFIRDVNRRSTEIHAKNGATYLFTREMRFGDRPHAPWHWYEKPLRFATKEAASPPNWRPQ